MLNSLSLLLDEFDVISSVARDDSPSMNLTETHPIGPEPSSPALTENMDWREQYITANSPAVNWLPVTGVHFNSPTPTSPPGLDCSNVWVNEMNIQPTDMHRVIPVPVGDIEAVQTPPIPTPNYAELTTIRTPGSTAFPVSAANFTAVSASDSTAPSVSTTESTAPSLSTTESTAPSLSATESTSPSVSATDSTAFPFSAPPAPSYVFVPGIWWVPLVIVPTPVPQESERQPESEQGPEAAELRPPSSVLAEGDLESPLPTDLSPRPSGAEPSKEATALLASDQQPPRAIKRRQKKRAQNAEKTPQSRIKLVSSSTPPSPPIKKARRKKEKKEKIKDRSSSLMETELAAAEEVEEDTVEWNTVMASIEEDAVLPPVKKARLANEMEPSGKADGDVMETELAAFEEVTDDTVVRDTVMASAEEYDAVLPPVKKARFAEEMEPSGKADSDTTCADNTQVIDTDPEKAAIEPVANEMLEEILMAVTKNAASPPHAKKKRMEKCGGRSKGNRRTGRPRKLDSSRMEPNRVVAKEKLKTTTMKPESSSCGSRISSRVKLSRLQMQGMPLKDVVSLYEHIQHKPAIWDPAQQSVRRSGNDWTSLVYIFNDKYSEAQLRRAWEGRDEFRSVMTIAEAEDEWFIGKYKNLQHILETAGELRKLLRASIKNANTEAEIDYKLPAYVLIRSD